MTLFRPVSGCGAACLSPSADRAHHLRQLVRVTAATTIIAAGAGAGLMIGALPASRQHRAARVLLRGIARTLLRVLGIHITHAGPALPARRALVVANHISWLDIIALLASADVRIVAKADVATWPIVGRLARLSGAIFIDRDRPRSLPVAVAGIRDSLVAGHVVVAFVEGTTSCGNHAAPYRPAAFQAAIDAGAQVVPVALQYRTGAGAPTGQPAFIGDETLLESLRRVLAMPSLRLDLRVGASLHPQPGASRATLVRIAERATPIARLFAVDTTGPWIDPAPIRSRAA